MSFLSGFYNRLSGSFTRPGDGEGGDVNSINAAQSDSANENDASSRTLSPDHHQEDIMSPNDDQGDVDSPDHHQRHVKSPDSRQGDVETPERAPVPSTWRVPPTPSFAPPATPFAGQASPAVNQAAADQLRREAESYAPTPALKTGPTPFFGIFAPPQTPAARNLSPVRNQAAEQQLMREMLGHVPETPATVQARAKATPMTQYKTPAMSRSTPNEPPTEQSVTADAFQTPSLMPSKRQRQNHSPIQEESEIVFVHVDGEPRSSSTASIEQEEGEESEVSATSSPKAAVDMDLSSADENDTSTTSIESSDSEKRRVAAMPTTKGRRNQRRPNQRITSKSYDDKRTRVQKSARPGVSRSVNGREELLKRARKRFYDRKADGDRLF